MSPDHVSSVQSNEVVCLPQEPQIHNEAQDPLLLPISVQYDDWKSSTERTLRVPECCYRAVFFTLDHVSLSCFTAVASHHFVVTRR